MRKYLYAIPAALALTVASNPARAVTDMIDCTVATGNPANLFNFITGVSPPSPGDTIQIKGICVNPSNQTLKITIPDLKFGNSTLSNSFSSTDGNQGQFEVAHVHAEFNGLNLEGGSADNPGVVMANVYAHDGASVVIKNSTVSAGQRQGVLVLGSSRAVILNSTVTDNGVANISGEADGIDVLQGSSLQLGAVDASDNPDPTQAVTVSANAHGSGVVANRNSVIRMFDGTIENDGAPDLVVRRDSSMNGNSVTISALNTATWPAVFVAGASSLELQQSSTVTGVAGAISLAGTSTVLLRGSSVTNDSASSIAINGSYNSSVISAGGNTLTNTLGNVVVVDHSSSFFENDGSRFGFAGAADAITGNGLALVESSVQLGTGAAKPSTMTGNFIVQQNSAYAMSGGITVTGVVRLGQQSNGFFNTALGGTNTVGGGVTCPHSAGNPASHVSNPTAVTPNVMVDATLATTTGTTNCLQF